MFGKKPKSLQSERNLLFEPVEEERTDAGFVDPDAVYFTVRRLHQAGKNNWVAEKLFLSGDKLVREQLCTPGLRPRAERMFRQAVGKYWTGLK